MRISSPVVTTGLVCGVLVAACSQPQATLPEQAGDPREVTLGTQEPSPLPLTTPTEEAADGSDPDAVGAPDGADSPEASSDPTTAPPVVPAPSDSASPTGGSSRAGGSAPEPVTLIAVGDRSGDHGTRGPDWADLAAVEMVSIGNDFRITARFGSTLPTTVPEDEVMLVSFDLGERSDDGNGYQLFVTGNNSGGWLAYFFGPEDDEPRPFPADGVFTIAGSTMTVGVPWNDVGSPTRGPLEVLAEWSRDEGGVLGALNPASEDRLDGQPHTFDRNP